ncbi:MAG: hypothetical protein E7001_07690 [Coriobacteriaceae bacterium]|nr:hypothetical protein [Coriobacteriaceae bacterium]
MSSAQKGLRMLSALSLVGAANLVATLIVLLAGGNAPETLQLAAMAVQILVGVILGGFGIKIAVVPSWAVRLLPLIILGLLLSAANVALAIRSGMGLFAVCAAALVTVGIAAAAHLVDREARSA